MRIFGMSRVFKRALAATAAVVASLAAVAVVGLAGASPASASTLCNTSGHAYLTQPGVAYFSGYEGNQQFGVPTVSYVQNTQSFRLGGNGIRPGSQIVFYAVNTDTGAWTGLVNGTNYNTRGARSNCVVNEEGPFLFSLSPGNYRVMAAYLAGNSGQYVQADVLANVQVQAPPPPPPYDPYDPGYGGYGGFNCGYAEACF